MGVFWELEIDTEYLERLHIHAEYSIWIGKEANNIDKEEMELQKAQTFIDEEGFKQWLLTLTSKDARDLSKEF